MAASRERGPIWPKVIGILLLITLFCVVGYAALKMRDYRLTFQGIVPVWEAKIGIPVCQGLKGDTSLPEKLELSCSKARDVSGYEFRVSKHRRFMWMGSTYQAVKPERLLGSLKAGDTYYFQVRAYKNNANGRRVFGRWSGIRSATIKAVKV